MKPVEKGGKRKKQVENGEETVENCDKGLKMVKKVKNRDFIKKTLKKKLNQCKNCENWLTIV